MNRLNIKTNSPEETLTIAKKFAKFLKSGDIVILTGDLGSGKTKFVEGFLSNFDLQNEISSPTFNIVNEYTNRDINIYHFDVYRLENSDEFYAIGGEEYFEKGICLIEWGEMIQDILPHEYIHITIFKDKINENSRILQFESISEKYTDLLDKFKEDFD